MRVVLLLALLGMAVARDLSSEWQMYKMEHGKQYDNAEDQWRFGLWRKALKYIEKFNARNESFTLGMNQFGDMTDEEYQQYLGYNMKLQKKNEGGKMFESTMDVKDLPATVDWRSKGKSFNRFFLKSWFISWVWISMCV